MTQEELLEIISEVQFHRSELDEVEVKSANKGTPQRLYETISAFSNNISGGVILFGLNEESNFEIVGVNNAQRLQEEISNIASSEMEPSLRPAFTVMEVEGKTLVAVEISGLEAEQKPCFYKPAGLQKGSYIRVGNTNRTMTDYEIFGYVSARTQPIFDEDPVSNATLDDLNIKNLRDYIDSLKRLRPQANYLNHSFEQVITQLRIVNKLNGVLRPTLAGLLMFGNYPQVFEPQLNITLFRVYSKSIQNDYE